MISGPAAEPPDDGGVPEEVREQVIEEFERRVEGLNLIEPNQQPEVMRQLGAVLQTSVSITRTRVTKTLGQGKLPAPGDLERYEAVKAGTADRLLRMAERAQEAEIDLAREANRRTDRYQLLALSAGFVGLIIILVAAYFLALTGHDWVAGGVVGIGAGGIIATLVNAPFSRKRGGSSD